MTETTTPADLAGKTRAELLDLCRARGLHATAWKKERMLAALEGREQAPAAPSGAVIAGQLEKRREDNGHDAKKAQENMALRNGACLSASGCPCEAYEAGSRDAFGWQMCECQHTQWAHAVAPPAVQNTAQ